MRCTSPRTVGYLSDGQTLSWSSKNYSKEYATFQLPCGKCISCRLQYAREWAIRCVHEAQMHSDNCFITLTYSDENLKSPKLHYPDFQYFMRKVRKLKNEPIGMFVTGEYGEQTKRPHWHAIIFNWCPSDRVPHYKTIQGHQVYTSKTLTKIWGKGHAELGSVTIDSAGYCARYAAKKLVHGYDDEHDYHPISKKSQKHAIGKKWLEKYWPDVFTHGRLILKDGSQTTIPRYYEKWLQKHHPEAWIYYVTATKHENCKKAEEANSRETQEWLKECFARYAAGKLSPSRSPREAKIIIQESKFKLLQANLKL